MTTLFVATTGGHLSQLAKLSKRIPHDPESVWITDANEQSRSMFHGRDVEFVPQVGMRSVGGVIRCLPTAQRLWRQCRPTRVVSTGSAIALGFLPYLAACGATCHYIESAARVAGPSLTGAVLQRMPGVRLYTQYPHWADKRWRYGGSMFDHYTQSAASGQPRHRVRVVVTVGTMTDYPFRRLITALVPQLAENGALRQATGLPVEVLWQTGCTPVDDLPIRARPFLPATELAAALLEADMVISHAGTGSALAAFDAGRFPILVARTHSFGEAPDDHQRQLPAELSRRGLALYRDVDELTVDDMLLALSRSVRCLDVPPPFALMP